MAERLLIVNADDLGFSEAVNAGIAAAHEEGIVTSASLMVRMPAAGAAGELSGRLPGLAVGLHIDIGEWEYAEDEWRLAYRRCDPDDPVAVEAECRDQLAAFRSLLGRDPTHLDSHQHVHRGEPVAAVARSLAAELGVPLRGDAVAYEGGFYGQSGKGEPYPEGISVAGLVALIEALPVGATEIGCHPARGPVPDSSYDGERERELETLCDPRVRTAIERAGVELRSFAELG
ncbi:MAG TPA: ChbG/HpnK family deacetylase [Solirubrobacterales bacterium]|nr:ChbG/HpnK family deacetylase [Solirubrobacterales bacterium]